MNVLTEKLQALLSDGVARGQLAGANLLVLKDGQEIAYAQAGFADIEGGEGFRRDTICRIYSMSKPVTAAAVMLLMERGQLDLGSSVGDILPAWRNMQVWDGQTRVPARRNVLIKDLLNMTSGVSYPGMDASGGETAAVFAEADRRLYGNDPMTTMELINALGGCGLAFHPGDRWMYGASADVLGAVVEAVSGMPFGEFLKREIFAPLGMEDTGFYVPEEKQHRLAKVYRCGGEVVHTPTDNLAVCYTQHREPAFQSGGAGLVSTVDDYAAFASSLLGHGKQLWKRETLDYFTRGRLFPWQQESLWRSWESMMGYGYSNLLRVLEEPGMALLNGWQGEYGWDGWLGTYFCNSPKNGVTVLLFCQRIDAGTTELTRRIRNVIAGFV